MWFLSAEQTASLVIATSVLATFGTFVFGVLWVLEMRERAQVEAERDELRAGFIGHYNAAFDFEAGLDDVYTRAGLTRPKSRGGTSNDL